MQTDTIETHEFGKVTIKYKLVTDVINGKHYTDYLFYDIIYHDRKEDKMPFLERTKILKYELDKLRSKRKKVWNSY